MYLCRPIHIIVFQKIQTERKTTYPVTLMARVTGWSSSFIFLGHRRIMGGVTNMIFFLLQFLPDHGVPHLLFFAPTECFCHFFSPKFKHENWWELYNMWGSWLYSQQGLEDHASRHFISPSLATSRSRTVIGNSVCVCLHIPSSSSQTRWTPCILYHWNRLVSIMIHMFFCVF